MAAVTKPSILPQALWAQWPPLPLSSFPLSLPAKPLPLPMADLGTAPIWQLGSLLGTRHSAQLTILFARHAFFILLDFARCLLLGYADGPGASLLSPRAWSTAGAQQMHGDTNEPRGLCWPQPNPTSSSEGRVPPEDLGSNPSCLGASDTWCGPQFPPVQTFSLCR
jgi:hypothetical protein